ncbi:MAG: hypothetical protein ACPGUV_09465 [Polyangiales bacterium]
MRHRSTRRWRWWDGLPLAAWALTAGAAVAGAQGVPARRIAPQFDALGFLRIPGSRTPGHLQLDASTWVHWQYEPVRDPSAAGTPVLLDQQLSQDFLLQLGLGRRGALGLHLPVVWWQEGVAPGSPSTAPVQAVSLADPRLVGRAQLVGRTLQRGARMAEGWGLGVEAALTLPAGRQQSYAGERHMSGHLRLVGDYQLLGLGVALAAGWQHRVRKLELGDARLGDALLAAVALRAPLPWNTDWSLTLESEAQLAADEPWADGDRSLWTLSLGAAWQQGDLQWLAHVDHAVVGHIGAPVVAIGIGLRWSPRRKDADGDGIEDAHDQCPLLPEDRDGFEDHDGCLDPDNDGDMILDKDDRCPNAASDEHNDHNNDGCTDG